MATRARAAKGFRRQQAMLAAAVSLLAACPSAGSGASGALELFVAPHGAAAGDGSRARPHASVEAARDAARAALREGRGPVTVNFLDGVHRLTATLELDARDSGRTGAPTVYRAAPGAKAVVSGGEVVSGWRAVDADRGLYEAPVGTALFRQVYLDGELLTRARHPNGGWHGPFWRLAGANVEGRRLHLRSQDWTEAKQLAGGEEIEIAWNGHWTHFRGKVGAVEEGAEQVAVGIDSPEEASFFVKPESYFTRFPYFFEGASGFLDEVGEWHHDAASGLLRVRFPPGMDPAARLVEVPRLSVLIDVDGSLREPVQHLELQGLCFENTNWIRPSLRGFPSTQLAQPYGGPRSHDGLDYPTGMIRVRHASNFAIRHCRIRNAGATGIQFWHNVSDSDVEGNEIGPVMANGIEIETETAVTRFMREEGPGEPGRRPELLGRNVAIWNNRIRACGRQYANGGAILAHFVRGLIVDHNDIADLPYTAIQIGNQPGGYRDWGCRDNLVRGNRIQRIMQLLDDGGGIYTLGGQQHGTEIAENFISDLVRSPWTGNAWLAGIYLDNYTQFVTVRHNVIVNAPTFFAAVNGAKDNVFIENEGIVEMDQPEESRRWRTQRVVAFRTMQQIDEVEKRAGVKPGHDPRAPRDRTNEPSAESP